mgnify:CR=1 FL=1
MQSPDPTPRPLDHLTLLGERPAPALLTREGPLDYAGLDRAVGALAAALKGRGLEDGARVASWLPKGRMTSLFGDSARVYVYDAGPPPARRALPRVGERTDLMLQRGRR